MNVNHVRVALVGALVAVSLSACAGADTSTDVVSKPTPTVSEPSPTPTVEAKPPAELPDLPILATFTARATDDPTGAILDMTLVVHPPQELASPAADGIVEVLTEAGDTSLLSVPAWRTDNQVNLVVVDLVATQVGDVAWPAEHLIEVWFGPYVEKEAQTPLGLEYTTLEGRFGHSNYITGPVDGHVIVGYPTYIPNKPFTEFSWFGFIPREEISNCTYTPTALAAEWESHPNWISDRDCLAGTGGVE